MRGHFRAFSFVDRIISDQPGSKIRGRYRIPAGIDAFPRPLIAESVGQLAAWSAMASLNFQSRPVAGIAASVELLAFVVPGQTLELAAEIQTVDTEAVSYCGEAWVGGTQVIRLNHCVGPMLAQSEFDDPQLVKDRYLRLCNGGADPDAFGGVPVVNFENLSREPGRWIRATLPIPKDALFFEDHFARRPVFPGTLFMNKALDLSNELASEIPCPNGGGWVARTIVDGKLRNFIPPGDALDYEVKATSLEGDALVIAVDVRRAQRSSGSAKIRFRAEKIA